MGTPGLSKRTVTNVNICQQFGGPMIAEQSMNKRILQAVSELPDFSNADLAPI
jgi:hypothetical protein